MQPWKARSLLALTLVALPPPMAGGASPGNVAKQGEWGEGPAQWLLLSEEWKVYRKARKQGRLVEFVEAFWGRRDPHPEQDGNIVRELFLRRVGAADVLYTEGGVMGSLTDRGRAFILLGSPAHVRVTSEPALAWSSDVPLTSRAGTREIVVETWGFRLQDLPEGLLEIARKGKRGSGGTLSLTLSFRSDVNHTVLIQGDALLELAARSLVRRPLP